MTLILCVLASYAVTIFAMIVLCMLIDIEEVA